MSAVHNHQRLKIGSRDSQSLSNESCQNILYKAVFEHFTELQWIAALLLASKSFQNSSFGANFLVSYAVDYYSIRLLERVLSPSNCFSLQFVPSLDIKQAPNHSKKLNRSVAAFVNKLAATKYLPLSLRSLTLSSVHAEVLSCFFGISTNSWPQLQDLSLDNCELNDSLLEIISKNAPQLRTANLSNNLAITDVGVEYISNLAGITSLDLHCCNKITDAGLEKVSQLSKLTFLDLRDCNAIGNAGLEHLSKLSRITSLNLYRCYQVTDVGLEHISNLPGLTFLNLYYVIKITNRGLEHLSELSGITFLDLAHSYSVTDVGVECVSHLTRITSLDLTYCNRITNVGLKFLSKLSNMIFLNVSWCDLVSNVGFEHLFNLSNLTSLDITCCYKITDDAKQQFNVALPNCTLKG